MSQEDGQQIRVMSVEQHQAELAKLRADALADLRARDERQTYWLGRALKAEAALRDCKSALWAIVCTRDGEADNVWQGIARAALDTRSNCPDGGACHHDCGASCWRVNWCAPLSISGWEDWPEAVKAVNPPQT